MVRRPGHPGGRRADGDPGDDGAGEAGRQVGVLDHDRWPATGPSPGSAGGVGQGEGQAVVGGQVAGHAGHRQGVGPVGGDVEVEHGVGADAEGVGEGHARRRPRRPRRSGSRSGRRPGPAPTGEQSIPSDHWPRTLRRAISIPLGRRAPMVASGTRSPGPKLNAPHTIWRVGPPSPASTSTSCTLSASGWTPVATTRATITPSSPSPTRSTPSTTSPSSESEAARSSTSSPKGAKSRSQESGTFTPTPVSCIGSDVIRPRADSRATAAQRVGAIRTAPGSGCRWR